MRPHLYNIFEKIKQRSAGQAEINELVEHAIRVALSFLRRKTFSLPREAMSELSLEDHAIEAIAPMFRIDDDNVPVVLLRAYESWDPPVSDNDEALYFFTKIIGSRVEQYSLLLIKDADPLFARIYRSVSRQVQQCNGHKIKKNGMVYVAKDRELDNSGLPEPEDVYALPFAVLDGREQVVESVLGYFEKRGFHAAFPLNPLVVRLKQQTVNTYSSEGSSAILPDGFMNEQALDAALAAALDKLETGYARKGKITRRQAEVMRLVLTNMVADIKAESNRDSLIEYVGSEVPGITKASYKAEYRNVLEYLYKIFRTELKKKL